MINLCFHGVGELEQEREPGERRYWVTHALFLSILDRLHKWPQVRLSFDDGNKSDILIALPALLERGIRADFFPLAGRLRDPQSVNGGDLRDIRNAGMTVGTHGWSHVPWRGLKGDQVQRELVDARHALAQASGGPIDTAALPLGRYDGRLLGQLREAGYDAVYTSDRMPARPGSWLQARYSVTRGDSIETITDIVTRRPGFAEARNYLSSVVKRIR